MIVVITLAVAIMQGVASAQAMPKQSQINHIFVLLNVILRVPSEFHSSMKFLQTMLGYFIAKLLECTIGSMI